MTLPTSSERWGSRRYAIRQLYGVSREKTRRSPDTCCLLERVRQPNQCRLTVRSTEEADADRTLECVTGGNTDDGVAGHGGWSRTGRSQDVIPIDQINRPRWL